LGQNIWDKVLSYWVELGGTNYECHWEPNWNTVTTSKSPNQCCFYTSAGLVFGCVLQKNPKSMGCTSLKDFGLGRAKMYKDVFAEHQAFLSRYGAIDTQLFKIYHFRNCIEKIKPHKRCKLILLMSMHVLHILVNHTNLHG